MTGYVARVILDSVSRHNGVRLLTLECRYPRFIHSEMLTHRAFSRNSASSRAIPFKKLLQQVIDDPVIPIRWGSEAKGMQQGDELEPWIAANCRADWLRARDDAVIRARQLHEAGLHKSICNRVIEPWMWMTCLITATDWQNFFRLRCHPDAEPHMQLIANCMRVAHSESTPLERDEHLPFVVGYDEEELRSSLETLTKLCRISAARCARVSYLTHDGVKDWRKDVELFEKLKQGSGFGHWSPMEHVATTQTAKDVVKQSGNFRGWDQFRKTFAEECASEDI